MVVACALTEVLSRRSSIASSHSFRYVKTLCRRHLQLRSAKYYILCKEELPMDVGFMLSDTLEVKDREVDVTYAVVLIIPI